MIALIQKIVGLTLVVFMASMIASDWKVGALVFGAYLTIESFVYIACNAFLTK